MSQRNGDAISGFVLVMFQCSHIRASGLARSRLTRATIASRALAGLPALYYSFCYFWQTEKKERSKH